jgi:hypothetical protein
MRGSYRLILNVNKSIIAVVPVVLILLLVRALAFTPTAWTYVHVCPGYLRHGNRYKPLRGACSIEGFEVAAEWRVEDESNALPLTKYFLKKGLSGAGLYFDSPTAMKKAIRSGCILVNGARAASGATVTQNDVIEHVVRASPGAYWKCAEHREGTV